VAVVADLDLGPGPGGLELLEEARRRLRSCARILISGARPERVQPAIASGLVHDFVAKPWRPGQLLASVQKSVLAAGEDRPIRPISSRITRGKAPDARTAQSVGCPPYLGTDEPAATTPPPEQADAPADDEPKKP
jgi:response regulator RpfG family c-di-GMP phosphodiesterase